MAEAILLIFNFNQNFVKHNSLINFSQKIAYAVALMDKREMSELPQLPNPFFCH